MAQLTVTGIAVGTPAYMSPEQSMGERELDGRSDVYSLGVVGYQMLAGELPFKASNTPAMMMKHVSTIPLPLRERRADCPAALAMAIDRSLAKKPEDRWASAAAFRDALKSQDESVAPWRHPERAQRRAPPSAPPPAWSAAPAPRAGAGLRSPVPPPLALPGALLSALAAGAAPAPARRARGCDRHGLPAAADRGAHHALPPELLQHRRR